MMSLSFAEEFFTGNGQDYDLYSVPPSDRPTNVLQAIVSLDEKIKRSIAHDVLKIKRERAVTLAIESESFPFDVLERVRETDLCDGYSPPVTVYIDPDQFYSLTIYED